MAREAYILGGGQCHKAGSLADLVRSRIHVASGTKFRWSRSGCLVKPTEGDGQADRIPDEGLEWQLLVWKLKTSPGKWPTGWLTWEQTQ